ncbi:MAG TPA: hypothetical protein VGM21_03980 [Actinomycetota bacterium]|jgi:CRISPR-associated protein (Cas_Cas02710)
MSADHRPPARRLTRALRHVAGNRVYELIVLQLLISAATLLAGNFVGLVGLAVAVAVAAATILGVRDVARRRRRRVDIGETAGAPERQRPGVILILSPVSDAPDSAAVHAIRHMRPAYLGFFGTPETDARRVVEKLLTRRCPELGVAPVATNTKSWDQLDLRDGTRTVMALIDWMLDRGLEPSEVVVDITGGTKLMSLCGFLAAEAKGVDCEYIRSEWTEAGRRRGSEHFTTIHQAVRGA